VYWPRARKWEWLVDHTGSFCSVQAVSDAMAPRIRISAINNKLGMLPVFAEVAIVPPSQRNGVGAVAGSGNETLYSPQSGNNGSPAARWEAYTLLPETRQSGGVYFEIVAHSGQEVALTAAIGSIRLDRFGNIDPGPNAGTDLRVGRLAFLDGLSRLLTDRQWSSTASIREEASRLRREAGPLLREAPYRVNADLAEADALARFGAMLEARDLLRETWRAVPYEDVGYRLAQMLAITGDLATSAATLRQLSEARRTPRGSYDAPHLLVRVATEMGDEASALAATQSIGTVTSLKARTLVIGALSAMIRLWSDKATAADAAATSALFAPEGGAVACLARWRRGVVQTSDVEAMRLLITHEPEATAMARAALGAVLLGTGKPSEAADELDRLTATLLIEARTDFAVRQVLDLVQALRAKALLAAGRPADARAAASELLTRLTPGLLPAILCHEVLGHRAGTHSPS
jgi:hypothetical protein